MTAAFWSGKRVFVTGHTGFKGGWMTLWLESLGAELTGFSKDIPTEPSLFELAHVGDGVSSVSGDVADLDELEAAMRRAQPEVVFHLAAQALVRRSFSSPVETYRTNVMGTVNLLEAVRRIGTPCVIVNVTSDKCYDDRGAPQGYREDDPLGGRDPYSSSKACAELVARAYRESFFAKGQVGRTLLASARAGNVIGGGDWAPDRLVPDVVRAAMRRERVVIRHPTAVRPWQHVLEAIGAYLLLAERLADDAGIQGSWNFGPEDADAKSVEWILDELATLWAGGVSWHHEESPLPETNYLRLDSTLARRRLGWAPKWDLSRALHETVRWYRQYESGADLRAVTLEQIRVFSGQEGR